jgi:hypothetical protein
MKGPVLKLNTKPIQRRHPVPNRHVPFFAYYFFGSACKIEATPHTTCRVKRHLIPTSKPKSTVTPPKPNLTQRFLPIVCPFEGHPSRPQTSFESFENL